MARGALALRRAAPTSASTSRGSTTTGGTTVQFGDGRTGARLPTGHGERRGALPQGHRPRRRRARGPAHAAAHPPARREDRVEPAARRPARPIPSTRTRRGNAPLTVLTLGPRRVARRLRGLRRAPSPGSPRRSRRWIRDRTGDWRPPHRRGAATPRSSTPRASSGRTSLKAIAAEGGARARFELRSFRPATFEVARSVAVDPDHLPERVLPAADAALRVPPSRSTRGRSASRSR